MTSQKRLIISAMASLCMNAAVFVWSNWFYDPSGSHSIASRALGLIWLPGGIVLDGLSVFGTGLHQVVLMVAVSTLFWTGVIYGFLKTVWSH